MKHVDNGKVSLAVAIIRAIATKPCPKNRDVMLTNRRMAFRESKGNGQA